MAVLFLRRCLQIEPVMVSVHRWIPEHIQESPRRQIRRWRQLIEIDDLKRVVPMHMRKERPSLLTHETGKVLIEAWEWPTEGFLQLLKGPPIYSLDPALIVRNIPLEERQ
jgi:hypothetical protein